MIGSSTPWIAIVNSISPGANDFDSDDSPISILLIFSVFPPEVLIWISALPVPWFTNFTDGFSPSHESEQPIKNTKTIIKRI